MTEDETNLRPIKCYRFKTFYHPYVCLFIKQLNRYGIDGLLDPDPNGEASDLRRQLIEDKFFDKYDPTDFVDSHFPIDEIDFSPSGAYSPYNWELFFHVPFLIANSLSNNQQFEDAQKWYHYIFDPTAVDVSPHSTTAHFWKIKKFYIPLDDKLAGKPIHELMFLLKDNDLTEEEKEIKTELENQIREWRANPFNPHLLARIRTIAYQKAIVMKYLDNLIAWGDHLFRRDTIESINEASQLYILAAQILGERPKDIPAPEGKAKIEGEEVKTFNDLRSHLDEFSNALIDIETALPASTEEFQYVFTDLFFDIKSMIQTNMMKMHLDLVSKVRKNIGIASLAPMKREQSNVVSNTSTGVGTTLSASTRVHHNSFSSILNNTETTGSAVEDTDDFFVSPIDTIHYPIFPIRSNIIEDEPPTSLVIGPTLFFCIPRNEKLLSYWDTVADRLFKIRYCMNIEGVVRQLPLFQPPIEPGLLVRAVAAGVDIASVLNDLYAPLPYYRFQFMLQKAVELCADIISLGAALLSALEKRDAEELALLRSTHEVNLLKTVRQVKELQIEEAKETLKALERSKETTSNRKEYYENLERTIPNEELHLEKLESACKWQETAHGLEMLAAGVHLSGTISSGSAGKDSSPVVTATIGGSFKGASKQLAANAMKTKAAIDNYEATRASILGNWERRAKDWDFQAEQAEKEIEQIEKQISAAEIRVAIAEQELENHNLQAENAKEIDAFMRDKFTNKQLYNWMVSQLSTIYFQSYQMAYDLAKKAEKAFRHEIGDHDATFIKFGYWDSLKKGLLAGERLHYDLKRMEVAYYDQNKREYEITKHISLAMLHPEALVMLKETGECYITLPEAIFDLDYPGHYMRRIKSVSLTIPCVTGPYTNVSCTLTLLSNSIRQEPNTTSEFIENVGGIQSIATSSAREDSGLFELNFRDERYLPFEGAGAISTWRIELPIEFKQFDYDTISDVVIHVRYTAREGGEAFKQKVEDSLNNALNEIILEVGKTGLFRFFSAKREFPNQWHKFLHPKAGEANHMDLQLEEKFFPFQFKGKIAGFTCQKLFVKLENAISADDLNSFTLTIGSPDGTELVASFALVSNTEDKLLEATIGTTEKFGTWTLSVTGLPEAVEDIGILCSYSI